MWIAYCAVNLKANRVPYNALENEQMFFVGNVFLFPFPKRKAEMVFNFHNNAKPLMKSLLLSLCIVWQSIN